MLTTLVSSANIVAGRMLAGMLTLSLDHPFVLCLIVSAMAGSACAVLLDAIGGDVGPVAEPARVERPIRVQRR